MFRIGQKVVCVKGPHCKNAWDNIGQPGPKIGGVYTVRSTDYCELEGLEAIRLKEIKLPLAPNGREMAYAALRFRPAVEKKTDISIFTAMLKTNSRELVTEQ